MNENAHTKQINKRTHTKILNYKHTRAHTENKSHKHTHTKIIKVTNTRTRTPTHTHTCSWYLLLSQPWGPLDGAGSPTSPSSVAWSCPKLLPWWLLTGASFSDVVFSSFSVVLGGCSLLISFSKFSFLSCLWLILCFILFRFRSLYFSSFLDSFFSILFYCKCLRSL